jgi:predicted permease
MGMPVVLGRSLTSQDNAGSRKVAVINQTMARIYFGGESPLGRTFTVGNGVESEGQSPEWRSVEVVGVVKDAKYIGVDEEQMAAAFYPHAQHSTFLYQFIARYDGDSKTLASTIARTVAEIDPNLPMGDTTTLSQVVDDSVLDHRLLAQLCTFFGVVAVLLACIGIYGLISYGVNRRTSEFGVRMALGAARQDVVRLVLREALKLVLIGVGIGLALSPVVGRLASSFLYGLKPYDPLTIGLAMLAMTVVALVAGYIPARRAARIDPMVALRYE